MVDKSSYKFINIDHAEAVTATVAVFYINGTITLSNAFAFLIGYYLAAFAIMCVRVAIINILKGWFIHGR